MPFNLPIERLFDGKPLIAPTANAWESGVTFNAAATFLTPTPENHAAFKALLGEGAEALHPNGVVVLHYRARPKADPGHPWTRSSVGLSIHEPDLTLIRRFETPVLVPGEDGCFADSQGAEDPRVTWIDGAWWMAYCGVVPIEHPDPEQAWRGSVCLARSEDLVTWKKNGATPGTGDAFRASGMLARVSNKDGVIFPDRIGGKVALLHRPMMGPIDTWSTCLALADQVEGPYTDLGAIHGAMTSTDYTHSWVGAGATPIRLGPNRYLSIEHTGNYLEGKRRKYVLDAFLYDFNHWDPAHPSSIVRARMDDFMRPETDFEVKGPYPDSVANVVFACGAYVYDGWLYLVYGGGDSFILAARLRLKDLMTPLEDLERINFREPVGAH